MYKARKTLEIATRAYNIRLYHFSRTYRDSVYKFTGLVNAYRVLELAKSAASEARAARLKTASSQPPTPQPSPGACSATNIACQHFPYRRANQKSLRRHCCCKFVRCWPALQHHAFPLSLRDDRLPRAASRHSVALTGVGHISEQDQRQRADDFASAIHHGTILLDACSEANNPTRLILKLLGMQLAALYTVLPVAFHFAFLRERFTSKPRIRACIPVVNDSLAHGSVRLSLNRLPRKLESCDEPREGPGPMFSTVSAVCAIDLISLTSTVLILSRVSRGTVDFVGILVRACTPWQTLEGIFVFTMLFIFPSAALH